MKSLQKQIKKYLEERNWDKLRPSDLTKSISIESAELMEIFQWSNPELSEVRKDKKKMDEIKKELAALLNIDSKTIIKEKLKHAINKYPAHKMRFTKGMDPGTDKEYLRIKKLYRMKNQ